MDYEDGNMLLDETLLKFEGLHVKKRSFTSTKMVLNSSENISSPANHPSI